MATNITQLMETKCPRVDAATVNQAAEIVRGLSMSAAEHAIVMSIRRDGLDLEQLAECVRRQPELTPRLPSVV